jgi:hypothetical protein
VLPGVCEQGREPGAVLGRQVGVVADDVQLVGAVISTNARRTGAALLAGGCLEVFGVNWATTMQQEIPAHMLSRLSAYDILGSTTLAPIGTVAAGPGADAFGARAVLAAGGLFVLLLTAAVLLIPEVRSLRRPPAPEPAQAGTPAP